MKRNAAKQRILAVDIGGSGLKAAIVDRSGRFLAERVRVATPKHRGPKAITSRIVKLVAPLGRFDVVTVGFPGIVAGGKVVTAPNLGTDAWRGFDLAGFLRKTWRKDVRVLNDADVQGLGAVAGKGFEMVCTLGTGLGTSLFEDGRLLPHLDLAHLPADGKGDFDAYLGNHALKKIGRKKWNRRVAWMIDLFAGVMTFDHLYLGGGNAKKIDFELPRNVTLIPNEDGLRGAAAVWKLPAR